MRAERSGWTRVALAAAMILAGPAVLGGEMTWVSASDEGRPAGATEFDLGHLADGEIRVFEAGDKRITVAREGDTVQIRRDGAKPVACVLGRDRCSVLTFDGETDRIALIVRRLEGCAEGEAGCDVDVHVAALGDAPGTVLVEKVVCEGAGDGDVAGAPGVFVLDGAGTAGVHVLHAEPGATVLRCPEGDTTMRLSIEEATGASYSCPKHGVALQQVEAPAARHRVRVVRKPKSSEY